MKQKFILFVILLMIVGDIRAQLHPEATIDINNIKTTLYGTGNFFRYRGTNASDYGYHVPADGIPGTIYQNTMWIAGLDEEDKIHCAAVRFNLNGEDFWSGPLRTTDASTDIYATMDFHHVWKIKRSDIDAIINKTITEIPEDILTWPAHGNTDDGYAQNLAPFVDTDGDGIYDPQKGDYPDILGDMALYCIYNDNYASHTESEGEALGVEIHCMLYGFNAPDDEILNNTLFMRNWIYNRSANTYKDVYVGYWTDFDLGFSRDDFVGCDVERGYYYCYNGNAVDGVGEPEAYGTNIPAQLVMILGGPEMDPDGIDNPKYNPETGENNNESINGLNFADGIADNERLGMTEFIYHDNNLSVNGDPTNAQEYHNLMKGIWKNGERMHYGGNGVPGIDGVTDVPCKFMFPHDSDPSNWGTDGVDPGLGYYWSEETGNNGSPNYPYERRGLASSGPFTFKPAQVHVIDRAYITCWPNTGVAFNGDIWDEWADHIRNYFINNLNK